MRLTPAERRRRRQRTEARRAILDATAALLLEGGYEDFSMRRLADRCGYTAPTIYHYFGDKPGLIDALLEERFRSLLRHLRRVPSVGDAEADLIAMARAFTRFGLRNPTHYWLLTTARGADAVPPRSAEEARAVMEAPLRKLEAEGRLALDDFEATQQALWALLHGVISLRSSRQDYAWVPDMAERSIDAMIRGLVEPARGERRRAMAR